MNKSIIIGLVVVLAGVVGVVSFMKMNETKEMAKETASLPIEKLALEKAAMDKKAMDESALKEETKSRGVMVGEAMMVPNLDIVANAMNAKNVTTVVSAVAAAGLVDTLKGPGPFTVFAPTNDAFNKLATGTVDTLLLPKNKADLVNILTYHVVPGRYTSADLKDGMELTTVQGKKLTITKVGTTITINGSAKVETADVISSNGITYVIDSVLMPPKQ